MNTFTSKLLRVNKIEKIILAVIVIVAILIATINVIWIAEQLGFSITTPQIRDIIKAVQNGATLSKAFALILGVAVPGWLAAAALALGLTSA